MDFAALMSAELSKAKPKDASKKYTKQSEAEAERMAAYEAEQARAAAAREAKAAAKRQREEEEAEQDMEREEKRQRLAEESRQRREEKAAEAERARRKRLGLPELPDPRSRQDDEAAEAEDGEDDISDGDAITQLREMGEPAILFGESRIARVRRLRKRTKGLAMARSAAGPIPTTLELVPEKDMKVDAKVPPLEDKEGRKYLFRQLVSYFSLVLAEYQRTMGAERRDTIASRQAYSAMEQCRENMKPLFRKFERADLVDSLLVPIVEIVKAAQERRYVDANDGYLRLSIGKAAWPIGVTMVGIHERSAREKLHNGERGHVMGDEITRKFLQSIKRCLTFAQVRWPPEDARQLMG